MPNQLSQSKRRQSLAEHAAVLAALAVIAKREDTTVMALLREAARDVVRRRSQSSEQAVALREAVAHLAPKMPAKFKTPAKLARFKRAQREFDQALLDMQLAAPEEVQARNSIASSRPVRLLNFDHAHAAPV